MPDTPYHKAGSTHFVHIGNAMQTAGFYDDACYQFYQVRLLNCAKSYQVDLHAYVLMKDRILILATPRTGTCLGALIRFLNTSYSRYFSTRFERNLRVWRDSYFSCLLDDRDLVMECQKYIEAAPLSMRLVDHPGAYLWSSYCSNSFGGRQDLLVRHKAFTAYLARRANALADYREFVATPFPLNSAFAAEITRLDCEENRNFTTEIAGSHKVAETRLGFTAYGEEKVLTKTHT